jgi:hypothetical protein
MPTVDELRYVPAGLYHLRTGDLTRDTSNPPLKYVLAPHTPSFAW